MEPVLLYGVPQGCSFGSIVALEWLGQPYRLCRINMPGDMQSDLYARINPVRETPALLLEDGTVLTESAAILQNIATRGIDRGLGFKQGTREYDRLNQVIAFLNTTYFWRLDRCGVRMRWGRIRRCRASCGMLGGKLWPKRTNA